VLDENDNPPKFIRMIVLPDQGVRVSNDDTFAENDEIEDVETSVDGGQRSPLLLVPENTTIGVRYILFRIYNVERGNLIEIVMVSQLG